MNLKCDAISNLNFKDNILCDTLLYCPAGFGHFSSAPVKADRTVRIQ